MTSMNNTEEADADGESISSKHDVAKEVAVLQRNQQLHEEARLAWLSGVA